MKYFSPFRFDEETATLVRSGRPVRLTRKAAELLRCLVERAGSIVPHGTILSTVWPGTHVQPGNVKVLVNELRRALGDDARVPQYIRSDPAVGYTFVAAVADAPWSDPEQSDSRLTHIFVNRRDELKVLVDGLEAASEWQGRLILLEGERGIGKTALCDAFLDVARRQPSTRISYGRCIEHARHVEPYFPILEALSHLTRQFPVELLPILARQAPTWLARLPQFAPAAAVTGTPSSAEELSRLTWEFMATLEELSRQVTTVLVLEDLHWGDVESIELLRALGRRHSALRLLVVATFTPYAVAPASQSLRQLAVELQSSSTCDCLRLRHLPPASVDEYVVSRFGAPTLMRLGGPLYAATQGHPFHMVGALNRLVESGHLVQSPAGWHLDVPATMVESALSDGLIDALCWQVEQLDPDDRSLLEAAAAVGVEFSQSEVATALGGGNSQPIARRLEALADRGFILRGGRAGRRTTSYRFPHPSHVESLLRNTPPFQQLRVSERLAKAYDEARARHG